MSASIKKIIYIFIVISALSFLFIYFYNNYSETFSLYYYNPAIKFVVERPKKTDIIFVGDVMLSRKIGEIMKEENNWAFPFQTIKDELSYADIVFGNLESPISKKGKNVGSIYSFRANPKAVDGLKYANFDIVSFANNHVWDYGADAFADTLSILSKNNILYSGAGVSFEKAHLPKIINSSGNAISFLSYTDIAPISITDRKKGLTVAGIDLEQISKDILSARENSDIVVVSLHWGEEYKTSSNDYQKKLARSIIDAGADLVIGHHPHVLQEVEEYKGGIIAYSLGNFIFDQNFDETKIGGMLYVTIKNGKIDKYSFKKVRFNEKYQPLIIKNKKLR